MIQSAAPALGSAQALAACAASDLQPEAVASATAIKLRDVSALGINRTKELRRFIGDTSFLISMTGGRTETHFAPDGTVMIRDTRAGTVEPGPGRWQVIDARFGSDFICRTRGRFPKVMAGRALVDLCRNVSAFIGLAVYLSRGHTFGLSRP